MRVAEEHVVHPDQSFRFLRVQAARFDRSRHRHRQLELTWIESGNGIRFVGDNVSRFASHDLVLVGADVPHAWVSARNEHGTRAVATVVQFSEALLAHTSLPELATARPLAQSAKLGLAIKGDCRAKLVAMLESMLLANPFERLAAFVRIVDLLIEYSSELVPLATNPVRIPSTAGVRSRVDCVADWIHRNMAKEMRAVDAARTARVSPAAFSRFFRREFGRTFTIYVNDVRCGEACLKFRASIQPVAMIAAECGFTNLTNFNRQFRRRVGVAPGVYRRQR